jgi:multiple sugar transport system ATP-binding protein
MAEVTIQNVWKLYTSTEKKKGEPVQAVKDLNLKVKDKEFMALLGPSGCGKTTTLRMVAGLEKITRGDIAIGGRRVNDLEPKDRDIAMAFETYALYAPLSVYENIAFPLRAKNLPSSEIDSRVRETARSLDVTDLLDRKPGELSGGQRQRVSLGRAIVRRPAVFLMDEPLSHLDAEMRYRTRGEIKHLTKTLERTVIYVTHDQIEAMALADRIAIMNFGVLQQVGTPFEVFMFPANEFVAGFIGSPPMNFLECTAASRNGDTILQGAGDSFEVYADGALRARIEKLGAKRFRASIRPNDITLYETRPTPAQSPHPIEGKVYVFEPLGEEGILTVELGKSLVQAVTVPHLAVKAGQPVWLDFDQERIHIFDPETGIALR